ncbi:MAG: GDYXXLXY domain-containing protein [Candidatus Omnitrophica bacterium]|nr:GDYXXLXY domain-containing protein [Candidatus Omnitrophota bacterium]
MNKKKTILILFSVLSVILIAVPVSLIVQQENIIATGQEFKFKTAPMDPFDAFRGRYVALGIETTHLDKPDNVKVTGGQTVFVLLEKDPDGFARLAKISAVAPSSAPYLRCRVSHLYKNDVYLEVPLDKYYLQENKAPKAEELYRSHNARNKQDGFILVAVKNGNAVIKGLYLGGKPIEELLKK